MFTVEIRTNRQLHLQWVAGVDDLDIAAVEVGADLHGDLDGLGRKNEQESQLWRSSETLQATN
jgi:hypothetical protein